MISLILGSASPRRKEILSMFSLPFQVIESHFDEDAHPFRGNPAHYVCELSAGKSQAIKAPSPESYVLTADTVVFKDGKIYNKPKDREDARRILQELNGKMHTVYTGVSLRLGDRIETDFAKTDVEFDLLTARELEIYLDKVKWQDKAGGYAIQGEGALLVKGINGCYYNVKGLPIGTMKALFLKFDVDLWDHLRVSP